MSLAVNVIDLEANARDLEGKIPLEALDIDTRDEYVRITGPVAYRLRAELISGSILLRGELRTPLACVCVRCLEPVICDLVISDWHCLVPLTGEDAATIYDQCVDLTLWIREDIVLALPQNPVCDFGCSGLPLPETKSSRECSGASPLHIEESPWEQLNKLKL